jgi:hypothetical protein
MKKRKEVDDFITDDILQEINKRQKELEEDEFLNSITSSPGSCTYTSFF